MDVSVGGQSLWFWPVGNLPSVSRGNARLPAVASGFIVTAANERARQIDARGGTVLETRAGADPRAWPGTTTPPATWSISLASAPDQAYTAVVRGTEDYAVTLTYSERTWASDCSCPMHYDCKHTVAAMLELQTLWAKESPVTPDTVSAAANKPAKKKPARRRQAIGAATAGLAALRAVGGTTRVVRWTTPKPASSERCRPFTPMPAPASLRKATSTSCFPSISVMAGRPSICGRSAPRTTTNSGSTWPWNCVAGSIPVPELHGGHHRFHHSWRPPSRSGSARKKSPIGRPGLRATKPACLPPRTRSTCGWRFSPRRSACNGAPSPTRRFPI